MMYLIVRNTDELPAGEYGLNESFTVIALTKNKEFADKIVEEKTEEYFSKKEAPYSNIFIIPIEEETIYEEEKEPLIGTSFYIE